MKEILSTITNEPKKLKVLPITVSRVLHGNKIIRPMYLIGVITLLFVTSCGRITDISQHGWKITGNSKSCELCITQENLGEVINNIHLNIKKENDSGKLTAWNIQKEKDKLLIITNKPINTKWIFTIMESGIDVSCSNPDVFMTGIAHAGEKRIPARIASQDNGIMYTQMGFVSATNIYNLFDMNTDIMIQFPKNSQLVRQPPNYREMKINLPIVKGQELLLIKNYYTDVVGLSKHQKTDFKPVYKPILENFKTAPTGWSSWYCYYMAPTEKDLVVEVDALAKKLKPYGLQYVQLDACFTRGDDANWLEWTREIFPNGGKWWFKYTHDQGLKPGLWVNIYGDNYAKPSMASKYPENYYLRDKKGKLSGACCSADTTVVRLDFTNPAVIEKHLKPLFHTLVDEWGLKYLKSAGWGTWMDYFEENRSNAYNPKMDSRIAYRNAQAAVREIMGKDNYIVGCAMHEIGVGFDHFDGSRTGGDDYASWAGEGHWSSGMQSYFKSLFGTNYLNGICWWSDPDDVMVRDPLTVDEARTIVTSISLSGQAYIISDFIADFSKDRLQKFLSSEYGIDWARNYPDLVGPLTEEKLELYRQTMPAMPVRAMDLYPFRNDAVCCPDPVEYPRALDLKINSIAGIYDVVALYNWEDKQITRSLNLEKDLGLDVTNEYLVFDYWEKQLLNSVTKMLIEKVPAHGTKALIIKKRADHPQLMATSRHLTCAYSIEKLDWNSSGFSLSGLSKTVPGDKYTMFIYVPENLEFKNVKCEAKKFNCQMTDKRILQVSFEGTEKSIPWEISFESFNR